MSSPDEKQSRTWKWIRWFLFSEGAILLLALAGPGRRTGIQRRSNHDLLASLLIDDPSYLEAVFVNFIAIHLFMGCVFFAAWVVTQWRQRG